MLFAAAFLALASGAHSLLCEADGFDSDSLSAKRSNSVGAAFVSELQECFLQQPRRESAAICKNGCFPHNFQADSVHRNVGHGGPVTAVDFHHGAPRMEEMMEGDGADQIADGLLLSSSVDWSIKLWQYRPHDGAHIAAQECAKASV